MGQKFSSNPRVVKDVTCEQSKQDRMVKKTQGRPAIFGTQAPSIFSDVYFSAPHQFSETSGKVRYYRVPGITYGKCVGLFGSQLLIQSSWPRRDMYFAVDTSIAEQISPVDVVCDVQVPDVWERDPLCPSSFVSLPPDTVVTLKGGAQIELNDMSGGQQRNICFCYASTRKKKSGTA